MDKVVINCQSSYSGYVPVDVSFNNKTSIEFEFSPFMLSLKVKLADDPAIYLEVLTNLVCAYKDNHRSWRSGYMKSPSDLNDISKAFTWSETSQGHAYWNKIYNCYAILDREALPF